MDASPTHCPPQWRQFLRALADELDSRGEAPEALLRGIGQRMAAALPLPAATSLGALEMEMNDMLDQLGWGSVGLSLHEEERALVLRHSDLPRLGATGTPPGSWLAPVLDGLYATWLAQQPGSDPGLAIRRETAVPGAPITLRYGRG